MTGDQLASRLLAIFISELESQLQDLNTGLLALEAAPTDAKHLGSVFRVVHTLKGAAHAAHVPLVEQVCHDLESLLAKAREKTFRLGPDDFSFLYSAADALADAERRLRAGQDLSESPLSQLRHRIHAAAQPSATRNDRPERETDREPTPSAQAGEPAPSPARAALEPASGSDLGQAIVRVETDKLDTLLSATGRLLITAGRVAARPAALDGLHEAASRCHTTWGRSARRLRLALKHTDASGSVLQSLDEMEDSLRGIVQDSNQAAKNAREDARILAQATADLGERVHRLRLRPLSEACVGLPRAVRDLAASSGKQVRLEVDGGDIEADRAVLEVLHEVLLHLVRNAVDHGLEAPAERERAGKPRVGTVTIAGAIVAQRLRVTVADDGRGLDLSAIRAQVARRGEAVPEHEKELARQLFQPGFSTRTVATAVSGRGVGLDVVRTSMERIRGTVRVEWVEGGGSTFILECPPALATMRMLLVAIGSQILAIPSAHIEHLERILPEEVRRAEGREVILTSQAPVPLVSLARLLGPPLPDPPQAERAPVVRLRAEGRELALVVDALLAEEEVVVRPVERLRNPPPYLAGAALLPGGKVALVLNPAALITLALDRGGGDLGIGSTRGTTSVRKRILVVDDSITTRTLEESILQAEGFDVTTAVDGADGWKLLQEQRFDLVVSDVEMPRMDGFELCAAVRASARWAELPIVLVTALATPEHRARGMEVGADAYLAKSSFDQQSLLDIIRQLLD